MWIGAIRLIVQTLNAPDAGTDSLVTATIVRDGVSLREFALDFALEDDLERGAIRAYDYSGPTKLPRKNDQTPQLPDGVGQNPMPYPGFGFEFSNGMNGHLTIRLRIKGSDMWIKDNVDFYARQIRHVPTSFDTLAWQLDADWSYVATWSANKSMSTDSSEGFTTLNMNLT